MRGLMHLRRGMAFILALVVALIVSVVVAGTLTLSVSHFTLTHADSSYANALYLAEAGVDWELQKVSQNAALADTTLTAAEPLGPGSFQTRVAPTSGSTWTAPNPFYVISTGTVDGVSRTVRVRCEPVDIFGKYALFGIHNMDVRGNFTVNGAAGVDGTISTKGDPNFNGSFWYHGSATGSDVTPLVTGDVYHSPLSQVFPTVNQLATLRAQDYWGAIGPQTVDFFQKYNNNALLHTTTGAPVVVKDYTLNVDTFKGIADGTIVFPSGDYYFKGLTLPSTNTIKIDDAAGPVNIWLGPEGGAGGADSINGGMLFASTDSNSFHLYEGSARILKLSGTSDFYGDILAYNGPTKSGDYYGTIDFTGDMRIVGSVIAYNIVKTAGTATITFPSTGGGSGSALYYGADSWEELNAA